MPVSICILNDYHIVPSAAAAFSVFLSPNKMQTDTNGDQNAAGWGIGGSV